MSTFAISVKPVEGGHIVNEQQPQASIVLHFTQGFCLRPVLRVLAIMIKTLAPFNTNVEMAVRRYCWKMGSRHNCGQGMHDGRSHSPRLVSTQFEDQTLHFVRKEGHNQFLSVSCFLGQGMKGDVPGGGRFNIL